MAISIDFSMFDATDAKLSKSADSLESALAQFGKNASGFNSSSVDMFAPSANPGSGFDEWLAADFSIGAHSVDETSSVSSMSPFSAIEDSPILDFASFGSAVESSLFTFSETLPINVPNKIKSSQEPVLTSAAVQQAAAALNIPWSAELESAVMAQAALNAAVAIPVSQPLPSPVLAPKAEPEEMGLSVSSTSTSRAGSPSSTPASTQAPVITVRPHIPVTKGRGSKKRVLTPEEEAEEIVVKRAKNTDAARRSRLKKLIKLEGLEAKVFDLEAANNALNMKIAILETEKNGFLVKDAEQTARIAQLEAQLAEAHAALTNRV